MSCPEGHCITCSDEGIPMRVLRVSGSTASCRDPDGVPADIDVALVDGVRAGDTVLAHAGVALAHLEVAS